MRSNDILSSAAALLLTLTASANPSLVKARDPSVEVKTAVGLTELEIRAFPNAPDGYTPEGGSCPSPRPSVRSAASLSPNETSWVSQRRKNALGPMQDLLGRLNITGFDVETYFSNHAKNISNLPNVAIAASGGGYRACLNGGGAIQAFDSREVNSTLPGHLGGLLQSATYLAGLSGGGWLVGSIYVNNFTTISGLLDENASSVWEFENPIFGGPATSSLQVFSSAEYFANIEDDVSGKSDAGYNTSITDYWGRALSYQLVNASDGGPNFTWSSIQLQESFANGDTPMPILVSDGRAPGELLIPGNTTVYEFNPFEFGSWDPTTYGFVPLEYLGSNFSGGVLPADEECVRGFDNVGFIMGTSSSLFNQFLLQVDSTSIPQVAKDFAAKILTAVSDNNNDIAEYQPNPFYGYHNSTSKVAQERSLTLVDGGEDLENIPFHPLIQPHRHVDVIFAIDSSADTEYNWPNGTSLVATYERSLNPNPISSNLANGTSFPSIPDPTTIVNLGLNTHPTFFGCNASNTTTPTPLIVYIPNYPYTYASNVSTFDPAYNISERNAIVENGYNVATMGNGSANATWSTCVGCAILSRSWERTKTPVPEACRLCFEQFCWDGKLNSTGVGGPYEPKVELGGQAAKTSGASPLRGRYVFQPFIFMACLAVVVGLSMLL